MSLADETSGPEEMTGNHDTRQSGLPEVIGLKEIPSKSSSMQERALTQQATGRPVAPPEVTTSWLNRNVIGVSLTSLFSDLSHEMATTVLPFFIIFDLGGSAAIVGLVEGVSDGASSAVKSYSGYLSDKIGKRTPIMYLGYVLTGALIPAIGFCTSWLQVLALRAGAWMGRGSRGPPRDALLTESVPAKSVGKAFGFQRAMDTTGAVLGAGIALLLLILLPHIAYSSIFFISFIPGVAAVVVVVVLVRETSHRKRFEPMSFRSSIGSLPRTFKLFLVGAGLFGISNFSNVIFTLRAEQVLQPSLGPVEGSIYAIFLFVVLNIVYAVVSFPVGHLADRVPKRVLLASGYVIFALACLMSAFETPYFPVLAAIFILAGLQVAIVDTVEGAYAAELLDESHRGSGFGVLQTINGIGDFTSSILIGVMITFFTAWLGFTLLATMAVSAAIVLMVLTRNRRPTPTGL
jgi:MFS family permease